VGDGGDSYAQLAYGRFLVTERRAGDALNRLRAAVGHMPASAEAHNDFKDTFDVHIYSVLPEDRIEEAVRYLAGRWAKLNPGAPLPGLFQGGHQPSLF